MTFANTGMSVSDWYRSLGISNQGGSGGSELLRLPADAFPHPGIPDRNASIQTRQPTYGSPQRAAPQRNSLRNMGEKRNPDDWVTGWNRDGKRYSVRKGSGHEGSVLMERPQGLGRNKQRSRGGNSLMGLGGNGQRSNPYNLQNNQYSPQITQQSNGMAQYSQPQPQQSPYSLPPQVPYTPQGIQGFTPQYTPPAMQPQPQAPVQQSQPVQQVQNQPYQSPFTRFAIANRNRIGFR